MDAPPDLTRPWWMHHAALFENLHCDDQGYLHADGQRFAPHADAQVFEATSAHDDPRVVTLRQHLYQHYYAAFDPSTLDAPAVWQPDSTAPLVSGPWHVLEQLQDGALMAQRGTLVRRLEPGEYLFDGVPARAGRRSRVTRQRPRWSTQLDPAFQYLFGETESDVCTDETMVRYYFAPRAEQLGPLITTLQQTLDQARIPFSLKYPLEPQALSRRDAVVLYVGARHAYSSHARLALLAPEFARWLRPVHALWTQPLLPGLSFAQDPEGDLSFGESRCHALAQGMLDAAHASDGDVLSHVKASFEAVGIDWQAPHLEQDDEDRFGLRQLHFAQAKRPVTTAAPSIADARLWEETLAIGNRLCADAFWHGKACNWITDDADDESGQLAAFARTMNGSLYDGTLGVAAYLAQLARYSGDPVHRDTAIGALWHALLQSTPVSISLYEGRLGIVTQGLGLARQLDEAPLQDAYLQAADALLDQLPDGETDTDLMHGLAGAVLGLLGMAHEAPSLSKRCIARADQYGEQLIALAQRTPHGWHWPSDGHALGLCGLSHGNAGIALAFAALHRAAPASTWQQAIRSALDYEAFWYLPQQANWPYLFPEDASSFDDRPDSCGMAWCHGAPGIALSRLALWQLSSEEIYSQAALAAFDTVASDLQSAHGSAGDSYTLCHGPAGNADMLLDAARYLQHPSWKKLARDIARQGVEQQSGSWRSGLGVTDGHALGLMLGLAGTGYFLLRCAVDDAPPSLMLPCGLLS
ncbi:hypothetical protein DWU98_04700 [Dyella monticola]|uniref:Uncharacterized protein n=1 Tax=Dyella monticola TaxID=1927958 RepID=A0A370X5D6_9GAMM|nr:lanthionine synthetase LanC family protein [Dyella monticola]RDS83634.1 hypothetical protein DWU98_04700 [Dyella monticola]